MQLKTIGFIGLGNMGSAIAQRIIKGGFATVLYARDEKDVAAFRGQPIKVVGTIKELCTASDLIGVCVFDDKDVNDVVLGEDGILAHTRPGGIVAIHSTVSVETMRRLDDQGRKRSVHVLDAPVSGRRQSAIDGKLAVMVGADAEIFEQAKSVFATFGSAVALMGPLGSGQKAKALSNVMNFANLAVATEGLKVGLALDLDAQSLKAVLPVGGAASFALDSLLQTLLPNASFAPHAAKVMEKDTRLYQEMCRKLNIPETIIDSNAKRAFAVVSNELQKLAGFSAPKDG
jgi:3-hydroxyisobutyrate dehydrogenase